MSKKRQNFMKKASEAFQAWVRGRDGECTLADFTKVTCKGYLQACHIYKRNNFGIRLDPDNCVAGCAAHHMYFTDRDAEWFDYIDAKYPGRLEELRRRNREYANDPMTKMDWEREYYFWRDRLKRQEASV